MTVDKYSVIRKLLDGEQYASITMSDLAVGHLGQKVCAIKGGAFYFGSLNYYTLNASGTASISVMDDAGETSYMSGKWDSEICVVL